MHTSAKTTIGQHFALESIAFAAAGREQGHLPVKRRARSLGLVTLELGEPGALAVPHAGCAAFNSTLGESVLP
jgi:hypothetical protein